MIPARGRTLFVQLGIALMALHVLVAVAFGAYALAKLRHFQQGQTIRHLGRITPLVADRIAPRLAASPATSPAADSGDGVQAEAEALLGETGLRITIIRPDGIVLADSHHDPATMDNHRTRPEIAAALRSGEGRAVRRSPTLGVDMVYVARRVPAVGEALAVIRTATPLTTVNAELAHVVRVIGAAALVSLVLTLSVVYVVSRHLSATVAGLARGAARFAAGDLDHRIPHPRSRELASLAATLDHMAGQLSEQIDRLQAQRAEQHAILQSMSSGVVAIDRQQRVLTMNRAAEQILGLHARPARRKLLQELVREPDLDRFVAAALEAGARTRDELTMGEGATTVEAVSEPLMDAAGCRVGLLVLLDDVTQLRRLESIRSDFAANVSHELRTPITNILGYVETMLDLPAGEEARRREFLEVIRRNARRLEAIVEDLLALARLEQSGTREAIERREVCAEDLIEAAVGPVAAVAREKDIAIEREIEAGLVIPAAPQLLEQAIGNLLSNAVNYSGKGKAVRVSARTLDEGELEIVVTDRGPGIAARHLPRLFERFYRVDRARSRALGGTGLGLAIVKHIALVHGGRAEVQSTPGPGRTFRLHLPRRCAASPDHSPSFSRTASSPVTTRAARPASTIPAGSLTW